MLLYMIEYCLMCFCFGVLIIKLFFSTLLPLKCFSSSSNRVNRFKIKKSKWNSNSKSGKLNFEDVWCCLRSIFHRHQESLHHRTLLKSFQTILDRPLLLSMHQNHLDRLIYLIGVNWSHQTLDFNQTPWIRTTMRMIACKCVPLIAFFCMSLRVKLSRYKDENSWQNFMNSTITQTIPSIFAVFINLLDGLFLLYSVSFIFNFVHNIVFSVYFWYSIPSRFCW